MSDILERLRKAWDDACDHNESSADALKEAIEEIERLQSICGAVTPGQSVADIKEHLRSLKKDKPDGSRESAAS